MGLLDDLEQEAQRRKASLDEAERLKADRESAYKTVLEPGMQALHEYLSKLTANLAFLKPKTAVRHEIPGYGTIVAYFEHEYDLKANKVSPTSKEILLNFHAAVASEECPVVEVSAAKARTLNGFFQKHRLVGLHESRKNEDGEVVSATFRARGKIPLSVRIAADADSAQVRLSFQNFDLLGEATKSVLPSQFNEQLFDEIGRFIARERSALFREAVSDDFRKQLQQKIQQDQLKRKWEAKIVEQQKQDLEKVKREQSIRARIDRTVQQVKETAKVAAPSLLDKVRGLFKKS
jgi:hypothetical protein